MNSKMRVAFVIAVIVLFLDLLLYTFKPLGENLYLITDWTVVFFALTAVIAGYYAFNLHGIKTLYGEALLFLVLGNLLWMFGELSWAVLETILQIGPFPSVADVFWYSGYALFGMGLYYIWKATRTSVPGHRIIAAVLAVLVALVISFFYGIFPSIADPGLTLLEKAAAIGYIILDFIIIVGEIIIIVSLLGRELIKPWIIILIAVFFTTFADIMYAQIASLYIGGTFFGILWDMEYVLMALGFFYYRQTVSDMPNKEPSGHKKSVKSKSRRKSR